MELTKTEQRIEIDAKSLAAALKRIRELEQAMEKLASQASSNDHIRMLELEQENAALKAEKDKLALDAVDCLKHIAEENERLKFYRGKSANDDIELKCLRAKMERAEKALKGVQHTCIHHPALQCQRCIIDNSYFEERDK